MVHGQALVLAMDECLPFRLASSSPGAQGAPSALGRLVNEWRRAQAAGCAAPALVQHHIGACGCGRCALFLFRLWRFPWGYTLGGPGVSRPMAYPLVSLL